jgi:hypothetical protein
VANQVQRLTFGPLFLALCAARAQHALNWDVFAPLHSLDDLLQQPNLGVGFPQSMRLVLLQPQYLDRLAAYQEPQDDVRRRRIPLGRCNML